MKICPKCNSEHEKPGKFCSRSCANSREQTAEINKKRSLSLKGKTYPDRIPHNKGKHIAPRFDLICKSCGISFIGMHKDRKYCNDLCRRKNAGGYREGSGRAKTGYYQGIYCGSTYELCWVIYNIDHGISFSRFKGMLEKDGIKYYPDFLIEKDTIIEIKGFEGVDAVERKSNVARALGYNVIVLRKEELEHIFEYVKDTYNTSKFYDLYDEYSPTYAHKCANCGVEILRDVESKTEVVYCSRNCSGKSNTNRMWITDGISTKKISKADIIPEGWIKGRK